MVANTYLKILHQVATPTLASANIRFLEEFLRIENVPDNTEEKGRVLLATASGFRKACDHVVITAPHGWPRQNKASFVPPMPQQLSKAIDSTAYGKLETVFFSLSQGLVGGESKRHGQSRPARLSNTIHKSRTRTQDEPWTLGSRDLLILSSPARGSPSDFAVLHLR